MPIKKKKISELTLSDNLKGLYTIGVKLIDGVQTSVKVGLEYIQIAYQDVVAATAAAIKATKDVRQLEATVEENEENREVAESQRNASEQGRQTVEAERVTKESERITAEGARKLAETDRSTSELARRDAEDGRISAENTREANEDSREIAEVGRVNAETTRETSEQGRKDAEALRVLAEDDRVQEFATLKEESETATENATSVANHPTYIGADNYVYQWDFTTASYNKTDIFVKGDAFNVTKTYLSVDAMNADVNNLGIIEGSFVLINTDDVENPDNGRLYVKVRNEDTTYSYSFLVDMSGAIGFTGKTPQFVRGAITTGAAGSDVQVSLSESGVDGDGNPVYALNVTIPRGNPGATFKVLGHFGTLDALKTTIPDGSAMDGFYSIGSLPYTYYAWYDGDWQTQGRLQGVDGKSAYQVAVDNGVVGTEAEWLASLAGATGKPGASGSNGTSCTHTWDGTVLTVTSASGTSSADLKGEDGNPLDIVDNLTTDDAGKALSAKLGKVLSENVAWKKRRINVEDADTVLPLKTLELWETFTFNGFFSVCDHAWSSGYHADMLQCSLCTDESGGGQYISYVGDLGIKVCTFTYQGVRYAGLKFKSLSGDAMSLVCTYEKYADEDYEPIMYGGYFGNGIQNEEINNSIVVYEADYPSTNIGKGGDSDVASVGLVRQVNTKKADKEEVLWKKRTVYTNSAIVLPLMELNSSLTCELSFKAYISWRIDDRDGGCGVEEISFEYYYAGIHEGDNYKLSANGRIVPCTFIHNGKLWVGLDLNSTAGPGTSFEVMYVCSNATIYEPITYVDFNGIIVNPEIGDSLVKLVPNVDRPANTLTSTSVSVPLSAAMGKKLNDEKATMKKIAAASYSGGPEGSGDPILDSSGIVFKGEGEGLYILTMGPVGYAKRCPISIYLTPGRTFQMKNYDILFDIIYLQDTNMIYVVEYAGRTFIPCTVYYFK